MVIRNLWHRLNDSKAIKHIPEKAGVYELGNKYKTVKYIGRAEGGNLCKRIKDHVHERENKCIRLNCVCFRYMTTKADISGERTLFKEYKARHSGKIPLCNNQDPSLGH